MQKRLMYGCREKSIPTPELPGSGHVGSPAWVADLSARSVRAPRCIYCTLAPPAGLEPATVGIEARCAIQLRHGGMLLRVPSEKRISE